MDRLKRLLYLICENRNMADAWEEAGYGSIEEARNAIRGLAAVAREDRPRGVHAVNHGSGGAARRESLIRQAAAEREGNAEFLIIHVDGACRGNPGPAAVAAVAFLPTGELLSDSSRTIGDATNNIAEYRAVLEGLSLAQRLGAREVLMRLDSELVVRQLNGQYRIKNSALRRLASQALAEAAELASCTFEYVPRAKNREADRLANERLDRD